MVIDILAEAEAELNALVPREQSSMLTVIDKLRQLGLALPFPHVSHIEGTALWELRPRSGASPWRGIYRREGNYLAIAAIGPDAKVDPRGFRAAVRRANSRLANYRPPV
jgi:hypothetical protein